MYALWPAARLPSQKVTLTVIRNKKQLIELILELIFHKDVYNNKLVIAENDPVSVQVEQGVVWKREDMAFVHKEVDTVIMSLLLGQQMS